MLHRLFSAVLIYVFVWPLGVQAEAGTPAARISISAAEAAHASKAAAGLAALWADPAVLAALEPVGALDQLAGRRELPAVAEANRQWHSEKTWIALVEALLARGDRMSVRAALVWMSWKTDPEWLDRAVALFPDEPEILLTKAMKNPESPGARDLFLKGLSLTRQMAPFSDASGSYLWDSSPQAEWWKDTGVVMALAEKAALVEKGHFPPAWCQAMRRALAEPRALQALPHPEQVAQALLDHVEPFPEKLHESPWPALLETMEANGHGTLARDCAVALLQMPFGPLFHTQDRRAALPPLWRTGARIPAPHRAAFGWHLVRTAAADRPGELVEALKSTLATRPADHALAFHVLLAQGWERPLTAEDLSLLHGLTPPERQRLLAFASQLLPESRLPAALGAEAVTDEIRLLLSLPAQPSDESRISVCGRYLERLRDPAAAPALARLLPVLFRERARLPEVNLPWLAGRVWRHLSPENRAFFTAGWKIEFLQEDQPLERRLHALGLFLQGQLAATGERSDPECPPEIRTLVSAFLAGPGARAAEPEVQSAFASLCLAAYHFPQWNPEIRRLASLDLPGDDWDRVDALLELGEDEMDAPDVDLEFLAGAPGQGTLAWRFTKAGIPAVSWSESGLPLTNPLLAAAVGRHFEAALSMDNGYGSPSRPLQRINLPPVQGSLPLTGLLSTGKLSFQLVAKKTEGKTGEIHRVFFNTRPALLDIQTDDLPPAIPGLSFLAPPVPCGKALAWQITVAPEDRMEGFHPVLLDAAGRVHSTPMSGTPVLRGPESMDQPQGWIIEKVLFEAGSSWRLPPTAEVITATGPPVSLALIATRQMDQFRGDGDYLPRPARITVRPLPVPLPTSDAGVRQEALTQELMKELNTEPEKPMALSGRLEATRIWTPDLETSGHVFFCGEPPKAVWFRRHALLVLDPLRDDPPVSLPLPLGEPHKLETGAWLGGKLWLVLGREQTREGDVDLTTLLAVDPFHPSTPVEVRVLPGILMASHAPSYAASPAIPALILEHYHTGIDCVITADGQFLTMDPAVRQGRVFRRSGFLSPTSFFCGPTAGGGTPVLDWTRGSLRVSFPPTAPEPKWQSSDYPRWQDRSADVNRFGIWFDFTTDPPTLWEQSLRLDFVRPLSENYVLGTSNGSLVRLRKEPF